MSQRTRLMVVLGLIAAVAVAALAFGLSRDGGDPAPGQAATRSATAAASGGSAPLASTPTATRPAQGVPSAPDVTVPSGMATVRVDQLPPEARRTLLLIDTGGPFPYAKDGTVFSNREGRLPKQKNGYYREYTVDTPGSDDRGARRIITGVPGERYYTSDHYATFRVIVP
ncbi:guanine-specific ribonuclease N1 and T1 [Yinghuangia sp. KLBMP8922]|uniref:Guanine-specific ribonuclease N1 and T1 n=2 Tax=Yinghuangia soli TaxID=2908204 RepID=A0AA41U313_9ACTN|nr:ribonuclease domain-containing protein [Yinghuangia soli]MCF2531271.1 guanine-specific ribonuclease N1 and T1 [Yinghuangia soli]